MAIPRLLHSQLRRRFVPLLTASNFLTPRHSPASFHFFLSSSPFSSTTPLPFRSSSSSDSSVDPPQAFQAVVDAHASTSTASIGAEESILPYDAIITLLDSFHDFTTLPWWIVIASSTLAMRLTLFPLVVVQLHKMKTISQYFSRLPFPFPPPLSGRSYVDQFLLFRRQRRAIGCPSYLWVIAHFSVQIPCFLLWMGSIRQMCLNNHSGLDCGGTLWFQNLTEFPQGVYGAVFPLLVAGLHYTNIQLAFDKSSAQNMTGLLALLAKYYKTYLNVLMLPLFFIGYCVPQGSLVYWVTNSSLSAIQQLSLRHPLVQEKLGLSFDDSPKSALNSEVMGVHQPQLLDSPAKARKIYAENLLPEELFGLSVKLLSSGQIDKAIPLLKLALKKDPEYIKAIIVMGQTLLQKGLNSEAIEYLESAITKVFLIGYQTEAENLDQLILASQAAGVAYIRQEKYAEGIIHFERVVSLNEPDHPKTKRHYFDTMVLLASTLYNQERKAEAAKYLRLAVAFDPAHKELLEQCEKDDDNFVRDLVSSRRGDY